ncbi:MAG: DUF1570 domain-containing protein [Phycisphaerales bacterium]|nr:DUF1570 domain-containing protein [Phycisphaerales bacterium]
MTLASCCLPLNALWMRAALSLPVIALVAFPFLGCASPRSQRDASAPTAMAPPMNSPVGSATGDGGGGAMEPGDLTVRVTPWRSGSREGHVIVTDHFMMRVTIRNGDLRKFLPIFTERALAQYTSAIVELPAPSRLLETYIFGTRDEWSSLTQDRLGEDASAYLSLGRGGYTSKGVAILYDIGPTDTLTILAHEGWHQYSQSVFQQELPVWLEEGISTYMEGYRIEGAGQPVFSAWRNFERFGELRDAVRRERLIPLAELLDKSPQHFLADGRDQLLVYYAQVWALTHFLAEGCDGKYRAALAEILEDAVDGMIGTTLQARMTSRDDRSAVQRGMNRGGTRALSGSLFVHKYFLQGNSGDLREIAAEYDAFVKQICQRGSGDFIWRGVSPIKKPTVEPIAPQSRLLREPEAARDERAPSILGITRHLSKPHVLV